jgi:hypothetical protein
MAKRMASGGQIAGEGIMREQARQTTANTLAASRLGAGSGSDLLTAALLSQNQEGAQMQNIDLQVGQQRQQMQQQAQQNVLSTLGQTAAAQAQQAGMEFQSQQQKAQQILGLGREQLGQSMALEQNLFQSEQAKAAAVAQARAAIWSGIGGIAGSVGSGLMGMGAQQNQMDMLSKIYGIDKGTEAGFGYGRFAAEAIGSGSNLAKTTNPSFGQATNLANNPMFSRKLTAPQAPVYTTATDAYGNTVTPFFN